MIKLFLDHMFGHLKEASLCIPRSKNYRLFFGDWIYFLEQFVTFCDVLEHSKGFLTQKTTLILILDSKCDKIFLMFEPRFGGSIAVHLEMSRSTLESPGNVRRHYKAIWE